MIRIFVIFMLGFAAGAGMMLFRAKQRAGAEKQPQDSGLIYRQAREKEENLNKILEYLKTRGRISNNDAEKLLRVSNATAERYLDKLEKDGLLEQVGEIGQAVHYRVKKAE